MNTQPYYLQGLINRIENSENVTERFETYVYLDDCQLIDGHIVINGLWVKPLILSVTSFKDKSIESLIKMWTSAYSLPTLVKDSFTVKAHNDFNPMLRRYNDPSVMLEYNHHMMQSVEIYIARNKHSKLFATNYNEEVAEYFNTARGIRNKVVAKLNA